MLCVLRPCKLQCNFDDEIIGSEIGWIMFQVKQAYASEAVALILKRLHISIPSTLGIKKVLKANCICGKSVDTECIMFMLKFHTACTQNKQVCLRINTGYTQRVYYLGSNIIWMLRYMMYNFSILTSGFCSSLCRLPLSQTLNCCMMSPIDVRAVEYEVALIFPPHICHQPYS